MPSCGFAETLKNFQEYFVAKSESSTGLTESLHFLTDRRKTMKTREEIRKFCFNTFGITKVTDNLLATYLEALSDVY
jgi:hypothetical protein